MHKLQKSLIRSSLALVFSLVALGAQAKPAQAALECPAELYCMTACPAQSICALCPPGIHHVCLAINEQSPTPLCWNEEIAVYCEWAT